MRKSLVKWLKYRFLKMYQDILTLLVKYCIFFQNKLGFRKRVAINMLTKLTRKREGNFEITDMADERGMGAGQMLTLADKGGGGVLTPPLLADIICEQPLIWSTSPTGIQKF